MSTPRTPCSASGPAAITPNGALFAAVAGGHVSALRELVRCGALMADGIKSQSALQAAVSAQQAETANLLHLHGRACEPLQACTRAVSNQAFICDKPDFAPSKRPIIRWDTGRGFQTGYSRVGRLCPHLAGSWSTQSSPDRARRSSIAMTCNSPRLLARLRWSSRCCAGSRTHCVCRCEYASRAALCRARPTFS